MRHSRLQECVYCPSTANLTDEHAPAKLIFPEPRPSDLITVKACLDCNQAGSKDAEYFRVCLCLNPLAKDMPSVVALKPTVQRSLQRPQAQRFKNRLLQALEPYHGRIAFTVEMGRIHTVIKRTVQCLYLHETGEKLPDTHEVRVASLEVLAQLGPEKAQEFRRDFIEPLAQQALKLVADNQFAYSVIHTSGQFVSVWGLIFYGILPFVAFTGRKVRMPQSSNPASSHFCNQG
jgi:hypothetical protein